MRDPFMITDIDEDTAKGVFTRNILNSRRIIAGDFETALADIIAQFEHPPESKGRPVQIADLSKRIARALRQGLAGLPPNGFEFCAWLWDVAPLYVVQIPQIYESAAMRGFHTGVIHLRKIGAMVLGLYAAEQPQRVESLVPMLDASVDWVDARNLIVFAFLDHYLANFEEEYAFLLKQAGEKRLWRKLLPLGAAARVIPGDPAYTPMALALLPPTFEAIGDSSVYAAVAYALRSAAMYGDHKALGLFVGAQRHQTHPELHKVFCETFRRPRMRWDDLADAALPVLRDWRLQARAEERHCFDIAIAALEGRVDKP